MSEGMSHWYQADSSAVLRSSVPRESHGIVSYCAAQNLCACHKSCMYATPRPTHVAWPIQGMSFNVCMLQQSARNTKHKHTHQVNAWLHECVDLLSGCPVKGRLLHVGGQSVAE